MGETNFDIVDAASGYKLNAKPFPLTEQVVYSVGAGLDFETFHDAMTWACSIPMTGAGQISLALADGTHLVGEPSELNGDYAYYTLSTGKIRIYSASGDNTACFLALPSTDDGDQYPNIFHVRGGAHLYFSKIKVEPEKAGYPYGNVSFLSINEGNAWVSHVPADGLYSFAYVTGKSFFAFRFLSDLLLTNITDAFNFSSYSDGWIYRQGASGQLQFNTVGTAFSSALGAKAIIPPAAQLSFTTVTTNYSPATINEIGYTGEVLTDGSAALSFKA